MQTTYKQTFTRPSSLRHFLSDSEISHQLNGFAHGKMKSVSAMHFFCLLLSTRLMLLSKLFTIMKKYTSNNNISNSIQWVASQNNRTRSAPDERTEGRNRTTHNKWNIFINRNIQDTLATWIPLMSRKVYAEISNIVWAFSKIGIFMSSANVKHWWAHIGFCADPTSKCVCNVAECRPLRWCWISSWACIFLIVLKSKCRSNKSAANRRRQMTNFMVNTHAFTTHIFNGFSVTTRSQIFLLNILQQTNWCWLWHLLRIPNVIC